MIAARKSSERTLPRAMQMLWKKASVFPEAAQIVDNLVTTEFEMKSSQSTSGAPLRVANYASIVT